MPNWKNCKKSSQITSNFSCDCEKTAMKSTKRHEKVKLLQFLYGLYITVFGTIRSSIILGEDHIQDRKSKWKTWPRKEGMIAAAAWLSSPSATIIAPTQINLLPFAVTVTNSDTIARIASKSLPSRIGGWRRTNPTTWRTLQTGKRGRSRGGTRGLRGATVHRNRWQLISPGVLLKPQLENWEEHRCWALLWMLPVRLKSHQNNDSLS